MQARKYPRFAVEAALVVMTADHPARSGRTRNISKGGLCADIDGEVRAGMPREVRLNLIFSDDAISESLSLEARVCWCTQLGRAYQVGLFFTLMQKRHKKKTTLITSNLGFSDWNSLLKNEHLTLALIDRMTESTHVINMKNCKSLRLVLDQGT